MTVIAWDGKTLAADKLCAKDDTRYTVTKVIKLKNGDAMAGCGDFDLVTALFDWYKSGANPNTFPKPHNCETSSGDDVEWSELVVAKKGFSGLFVYEKYPTPIYIENARQAYGCGADIAYAALQMGKTARQAVDITCMHKTTCGGGVDSVVVNGPSKHKKRR